MGEVRWPDLRPEHLIAVVSPASACPPAGLARGLRRLRERGHGLVLGASARRRRDYLAGTDAERAADFNGLWADERVGTVWCARGGYGTMRLLDRLDWELFARRPLPLIGFSDITALQLALVARCGLVSFAGPMVGAASGYGRPEGLSSEAEESLWRWLRPGPRPPVIASGLRVLRPGRATGRLLGGNLSLVAALVGTPWLPDLTGAVLVLEDVGETPYRIDRLLCQLRLAGWLDRLGGLLLGDFASCFPPACESPGPPVEELVLELLGPRDIPVLAGLHHGHVRDSLTLPIGALVELSSDRGELRLAPE